MKSAVAGIALVGLALVVSPGLAQTGEQNGRTYDSRDRRPAEPGPFVTATTERVYEVTGTVVSSRGGRLVVRIDDHGHRIPFELRSAAGEDVRPGSRVSVRYRPTGSTGQAAEEVRPLSGDARASRPRR